MCDVCHTAGTELIKFLDELVEKFPGESVEGQQVEKSHHMEVAVVGAAMTVLSPESQLMLAQGLLAKNGIGIAGIVPAPGTSQQPARGPFGPGKVIES